MTSCYAFDSNQKAMRRAIAADAAAKRLVAPVNATVFLVIWEAPDPA